MDLTMSGGVKIPLIGLGTWAATDEEELEKALNAALEIGYRHIDTATAYNNEHVVGKVLKQWLTSGKLKREEIFVTTKLPMTHMDPAQVETCLKESLQKLQLDYVDLYLINFPILMKFTEKSAETMPTDQVAVWKEMEKQVDAKRARTIGVSNLNIQQIDRILKNSRIKPVNVQVELHVYLQQKELVEYCKKNNITLVAYSSLGSPGAAVALLKLGRFSENLPKVLNILRDPAVTKIAQKHNKTTGQVVLRYWTQKDIVVIPKSVNPVRLKENFDFLDFTLDSNDMKTLESLDKGEDGRIFRMDFLTPTIKQHPEYPFRK